MIEGKFQRLVSGKSRPPLSDDQKTALIELDSIYTGKPPEDSERYYKWLYLSQCRDAHEDKAGRVINSLSPAHVSIACGEAPWLGGGGLTTKQFESEHLGKFEPQEPPKFAKIAHLLKMYGVPVSVRTANKMLGENGIIVKLVRASTKNPNDFKHFKILSAKGLDYGKNIPAYHPNETEIVYDTEKFKMLIPLLTQA